MPRIKVNNIEMYYEVTGSGEPLVLIAGLGYPLWMWHRMVPYLAQRFQVIAFDNRGVGQTDKPAGPYTAQMLAADTACLLEALGIEKAIVMGHSMGGFIAQAMALDFPQKISRLILAATNFGGPRHIPITSEAMAILSDVTSDPLARFKNGLMVSTAPGWADQNPEIIKRWTEWRITHPIEPLPYQAQMAIGLGLILEAADFEIRLLNISAPTLILFGKHDRVVPPGNADLLAKQIPNSQIAILPDAGHFFPMEVPQAASKVVIDFTKQEVQYRK